MFTTATVMPTKSRKVGKGRLARAGSQLASTMVRLAQLWLRAGWLHASLDETAEV
jgi:hypothetical protein